MKIALNPTPFHHDYGLLDLPGVVVDLGFENLQLTPHRDFIPFFNHSRADDALMAKFASPAAMRGARSIGGFAARSSTATQCARFLAVVPPAVCTRTTSGTGKTAAPPSCSTWYWWYALIITGCTIEASSPSPDPPTSSSSPTAPGGGSAQDRSRVRRTFPRPQSHRAPGPPASAPTGGGTNPSSRSHHQ
jgi:hypothetical protein